MENELSTLVTDYLLGMLCFLLSLRLNKLKTSPEKNWLALSLFFLGISAFLAGTWHWLHHFYSLFPLWVIAMMFLFGFSFTLLTGSFCLAFKSKNKKHKAIIFSGIKTIIFFAYFIVHPNDFHIPFYDYSISLVIILILSSRNFFMKNQLFQLWIVGGVLFAFFAGFLWMLKIPSLIYFNYNDLFHVLQMVSAIFIYWGFRAWLCFK